MDFFLTPSFDLLAVSFVFLVVLRAVMVTSGQLIRAFFAKTGSNSQN
ncbi:hypothetical protein [Phaeovulum veldkampii]|nr:hypothetical protein [Phaeovulum veldkampii]TDQ64614.1 hypothetical protein EV658_10175 [Phaeovulum veldkampii DSM 11550]